MMDHERGGRPRFALVVAVVCGVLGMVTAGTSAASAAPAAARPPASVHHKPVPVRPPAAANAVSLAKAIAGKRSLLNARPLDPAGGWTVTLAASSNVLWPTQYSTLTATANADVGPTPYYISIYDATTGTLVAICGIGTSCSVSQTQPTASTQTYVAYIDNATSSFPPGTIAATSNQQPVQWQSVTVGMIAGQIMPALGQTVLLEGVASADVGPSPFYIEIFDATTNTLVDDCGSGQICSISVSESAATTQEYIAYVADFSTTFPPAAIQATSVPSFVTWSNETWSVSLSGQSLVHGPQIYTATANRNVGPTPYFIEIWDETTGALLTVCGASTSCSASYQPGTAPEFLIAFVASYSSSFPPANIQANSGDLETLFRPL